MADLHIFFLPFLAPGHMIPMVDLAKLLAARRNIKATIITTAANTPLIAPSISHSPHSYPNIQLRTLPFPPSAPNNFADLPTPDLTTEFVDAVNSLKNSFNQLIIEHRPNCIVSDIFYPWTVDLASDHNIPRLAFHGTSAFSATLISILSTLKPYGSVSDEDSPFVVPGIPHRIEMLKSHFPITKQDELFVRVIEAQKKTYGTIMNTFAELEAGYTDNLMGKSWLVGPVSLCNRDVRESAARGGKGLRNLEDCMNWLDSKKPGSVLYVCFGSLGRFTLAQLREITTALGDSDHPFVWVVRDEGEWVPEGLERKGLIIRGWAPQMAILSHCAVGGFMTHCGWNSCLEGVTAGVPMVTWPQFAEQFLNEKLVVDVVRIGVSVGAKVCSTTEEKRTLVKAEVVTKAVNEMMGGGEEAEGRRKRAKEVAAMARTAMEEGGSSYVDISRLIQELTDVKNEVKGLGLDNKN